MNGKGEQDGDKQYGVREIFHVYAEIGYLS